MTLINSSALVVSCALMATVTVAAQSNPTKLDATPLTLTGCVSQGDASNSYLIRNVTVGGAGVASAPAAAYFRLDTTDGLKEHVNHQVEISGEADLTDIDKGILATKSDGTGQSTTSLNSERRTVTSKDAVWAGTVGTETSVKAKVDTYGFKVGGIRMLSSTCS